MSAEQHSHSSYSTGDIHNQIVEIHNDPSTKRDIWRTYWIVLAITIFEVSIAFTSHPHILLKWTFIVLTLVKAYIIVFFFMHLKHERKFLKYIILLPFLFIVYFIIMELYEANAVKVLTTFFAIF